MASHAILVLRLAWIASGAAGVRNEDDATRVMWEVESEEQTGAALSSAKKARHPWFPTESTTNATVPVDRTSDDPAGRPHSNATKACTTIALFPELLTESTTNAPVPVDQTSDDPAGRPHSNATDTEDTEDMVCLRAPHTCSTSAVWYKYKCDEKKTENACLGVVGFGRIANVAGANVRCCKWVHARNTLRFVVLTGNQAASLKMKFDAADTDNDGSITKTELDLMVTSLQLMPQEKQDLMMKFQDGKHVSFVDLLPQLNYLALDYVQLFYEKISDACGKRASLDGDQANQIMREAARDRRFHISVKQVDKMFESDQEIRIKLVSEFLVATMWY